MGSINRLENLSIVLCKEDTVHDFVSGIITSVQSPTKKSLVEVKTANRQRLPPILAEDSVSNWQAILKQFKYIIDSYLGPSKSDSAPVQGDLAYEPAGLRIQQSQHRGVA